MSERFVKTQYPGYYRDSVTHCIINTNDDEYKRILAERAKNKRIVSLEQQLAELKALVEKLI